MGRRFAQIKDRSQKKNKRELFGHGFTRIFTDKRQIRKMQEGKSLYLSDFVAKESLGFLIKFYNSSIP